MLQRPVLVIGVSLVVLSMLVGCGGSADSRSVLFERPADNDDVRLDIHGGYVVGSLVLGFNERTNAYTKLSVTAHPDTHVQLPSGDTRTVEGEATYMFSVWKPLPAGSSVNSPPASVALIADGLTVFSTQWREEKYPGLSSRTRLDVGSGAAVHGFNVTTTFNTFLRFANARKPEIVIDGEQLTLTTLQVNALRVLGARVAQSGGRKITA